MIRLFASHHYKCGPKASTAQSILKKTILKKKTYCINNYISTTKTYFIFIKIKAIVRLFC